MAIIRQEGSWQYRRLGSHHVRLLALFSPFVVVAVLGAQPIPATVQAQEPITASEFAVDLKDARRLLYGLDTESPPPASAADFAPQPWEGGSGHLLALTLLHVYRNTFARTDLDLCAFRPSCSRFAQLAIDEFGLLRGVLLGTDRLLRDGPSALDYGYVSAGDGRHLLDPIEDYRDVPCTDCGILGGGAHD